MVLHLPLLCKLGAAKQICHATFYIEDNLSALSWCFLFAFGRWSKGTAPLRTTSAIYRRLPSPCDVSCIARFNKFPQHALAVWNNYYKECTLLS